MRRKHRQTEEPRSSGADGHDAEASHAGCDVSSCNYLENFIVQETQKELMGPSETLAAKGKYANVESSPLPLQRALLSSVVSRKCGPSTPVPSWKMYDAPFQGSMEVMTSDADPKLFMREMASRQGQCPRSAISARKLAAALWDMQGALNPSRNQEKESPEPRQHNGLSGSTDRIKGREDSAKQDARSSHRRLNFEDREGSSKQPRASKITPKEPKSRNRGSPASGEAEVPWPTVVDGTHLLGEHGSTLSSELAKLLNQIFFLEAQCNESSTLVASLRSELKKTKSQIKELRKEQNSYQGDLEIMNKKLSDEKKMLMDRAEEAAIAAVKSVKDELETEKKSKVKLEAKHKKLSKEINEARKTLTKTVQDFEREQKARELMEDVCDELAREIGEDKAQVEELRRQSAKYREEVEQERRMLQMAEVWREERVHMKLAEARFELEEKNSALDRLRSELEAFLRAKRSLDEESKDNGTMPASNSDEAAISGAHATKPIQAEPQQIMEESTTHFFYGKTCTEHNGPLEDEDSPDDDLHSIELNRASCSESHEGIRSAHCNNANSESMANAIHSPMNAALFQLPANGSTDLKHGQVGDLVPDRIFSSSGKTVTNDVQDFRSRLSGMRSERSVKDWDLGRQPALWSSEALPRFWHHDNNEEGSGVNAQDRSYFGRTDRVLRSTSAETNGAVPQGTLGLNGQVRNGYGQVDGLLREGDSMGPTHQRRSNLEIFELQRDHSLEPQSNGGLLSSELLVPMYPSSPTRKWSHSLSSPDQAKRTETNETFESTGKVFRDNSLKARLLEAKLESQQARARNRKTPVT